MKFLVFLVAVLCVCVRKSYCLTCTECATNYDTATTKDCAALVTFLTCLETATACPLAADKSALIGTELTRLGGCSLNPTCTCQANYWKTDLATNTDAECGADKTFFNCLKGKTDNSCGGQKPHELATGHVISQTCLDTSDTCGCVITYLRTDITGAGKCDADKAFITCMKGKNATSCDGTTKASAEASYPTIDATCIPAPDADACGCDKQYAETDITTVSGKCAADKVYLVCLKGKTTPICDGTAAGTAATNHPVDQTCTKTCQCEIERARADPASQCDADKAFITCMKNSTDLACDGVTPAHEEAAKPTIATDCIPASSTDACGCDKDYALTDRSTDDKKCTADKVYLMCLRAKENPICDGTIARTAASNHPVAEACSNTFTDACACEVVLAKSDVIGTDAAKCQSFTAFLVCMRTAKGVSCVGDTPAATLVKNTKIAINGVPDCGTSKTCQCEIAHAQADPANQCTADKAFITCMKNSTDLACDGVTPAHEEAAKPTIAADCIAASINDSCGCDKEYATTDRTSVSGKCDADKAFLMCLKGKATPICDETPAKDAATAHTVDPDCISAFTDTCTCEVALAKKDSTTDPNKCQSYAEFLTCMNGTAGNSCVGNKPAATVVKETKILMEEIPGCATSATCQCEIAHAKADVSTSAAKCIADKNFITCMKNATDLACDGTSKAHEEAAKPSITIECIGSATTDACGCDKQYVVTDISTADNKCTADKVYLMCLKEKATPICDGTTASTAATNHPVDTACSDAFTETCKCEVAQAKRDATNDTKKCESKIAFLTCMKGQTDLSCVGDIPGATLVKNTILSLEGISGCATSTCQCEIDYEKSDLSPGAPKCSADKAFISCMKGKREVSCNGSPPHLVAMDHNVVCSEGISASCNCDTVYAREDISTPEKKCAADKRFLMCLKDNIDKACDERESEAVAATHPVDASCSNAFTDTCKCETNLAKSDVTTTPNKCGSYKTFMSCLKTATRESCVNEETALAVVAVANTTLLSIPDCEITPTCACEISYAQNNLSSIDEKCSANRALVKCLRNETAAGCVASTTVASLVDLAAAAVPNCTTTATCKCEQEYTKGIKTTKEGHCSNAKSLFACLYNITDNSDVTCDGGPKTDLQAFARGLITREITDCALDDTCLCEELMSGGTCADFVNGIDCLRKAKARGCGGVKIVKDIADETAVKIKAIQNPVCTLQPACQCELTYASADKSTDDYRCIAAKDLKTCLNTAKTAANGADLKGCNSNTAVSEIITDMDTIINDTCGAMQSCFISVLLLVFASLTAHLLKN